jgi:hypothetical protein
MKLKKLMLAFLLMLLPTLTLTAQQSSSNSGSSGNEYGLDSEATYQGAEVIALLDIQQEEADAAILDAFNNGYKAALLEYKPQNVQLQSLNDSLSADLASWKKTSIPRWQSVLWNVGTGAVCLLGGYGLRCIVAACGK